MKAYTTELSWRVIPQYNTQNKFSLLVLIIFTLFAVFHLFKNNYQSPLTLLSLNMKTSDHVRGSARMKKKSCAIFSGRWIPYPEGPPYYSNESCRSLMDQHNCMKFGRPDKEFMNWRWKPNECELPLFNPAQFLELVRGKSMAFVGDSVGLNQMQSLLCLLSSLPLFNPAQFLELVRGKSMAFVGDSVGLNQMQSLLCLLSSVAYPEDISHKYSLDSNYFKRHFYADYRFTVANFWSPFLVKSSNADNGHSLNGLLNLYLDEADEAWVNEVENFDYVIVSAGQWFFRPLIFYENSQVIGCHICDINNMTAIAKYYGYRMAFRTAFRTLQSLKNYKGTTFLRTFSPAHFENGDWDKGGNCVRKRPFTSQEMKLNGDTMEFYSTQVVELRAAEKQGRLKFRLLDTTEIMLLRPDGHPNKYGQSPHKNVTVNDCVHWCLPGPIDAWNEFLLYVMKTEDQRRDGSRL
ncbi:protein trichome birefringence-like 19 [Pistacia vera]|uniref:protein trichome birefringence-like 19 n=1 Tax=Pistacia vera TaxID=55513 RepID=UPI0012634913|nr:protein trichome birefringence-like 19 [Pistacia vera]